MKPPFPRIGNKMPIINELLEFIPEHDLYVEVFTGSGALFFNKPITKSILNDLDEVVTNRLKLLKKVPLFEWQPNPAKTLEEYRIFFDRPIKTLKDAVLHEMQKTHGFYGTQVKESKYLYRPRNPYEIAKLLPEYKKYLSNATITNHDYKYVLKKYDSPTTFFYLDPPYEDTNMYTHSTINYEEMKDILLHLKGYFLLSINDSPYIRNLFKDFHVHPIKVSTELQKKKRKELLIMNYV
jgi:DNA adenine methylase